jgi:Flp pilus assembly protein TadD
MSNSLRVNFVYSFIFAGMFVSCSTATKDTHPKTTLELPSSDLELSVEKDKNEKTEKTEIKKENHNQEVLSVPSALNDQKYAALSKALRASGRSSQQVYEEAGKILAGNPDDATALNGLALYHMRLGRYGAAKLLLGRAIEKATDVAALHNNYGVILLEEDDLIGAMSSFKKALRLDDHHVEALGNLGSLYVRGGDYTRGLPLLEESYNKKGLSSSTMIAMNYAIALGATGNPTGAAKVYDGILNHDSRNALALINYATLLIDKLNKPKDGLALVYKVKFLETDKKEILGQAEVLEKKAKAELK